jgi:FkbM family methyltransferase
VELAELQRNWNEFGQTDPLWSVLTDMRFKNNKWDPVAFFQTGEKEIDAVLAGLDAMDIKFPRRRALDFGCAVGRLTQALCRHFERCDGVDIAPSMIELARKYDQYSDRCHYHLNEKDNLELFPDNSFDLIYSRIVLQHMQPRYSKRYIAEFMRVLAPGGVAIFQVPGDQPKPRPGSKNDYAMSEAGFKASITVEAQQTAFEPGETRELQAQVTNASEIVWPSGQHATARDMVVLGNHWLTADGKMLIPDDGRTPVMQSLQPSESASVLLHVTAPSAPGPYILELDMVQEGITWFKHKGSQTLRMKVDVRGTPTPQSLKRPPVMEIYGVSKLEVLRVIEAAGGKAVHVLDDDSVGGWASFNYIVTKIDKQKAAAPSAVGVGAQPSGSAPDGNAALLLLNGLAQHTALQAQVNEGIVKRLLSVEKLVRETHTLLNHLSAGTPQGGRFAVYQGNDTALTRILNRHFMYVDTTDLSVAPHLMMHGQWEPAITNLFTQLVRPGMTVVDIGANFGYYTILAGSGVGAEGKVYALEADPRNYEILRLNVEANGLNRIVETRQCAVLDVKKPMELNRNRTLLGCHSLFAGKNGTPGNTWVDAVPLDDIVPGSVDLMKIDAEGSEPYIFDGMRGVLARSPRVQIIVEFNVPVLKVAGVEPLSFLRKIQGQNFKVSIVTPAGGLEPLNERKLLDGPLYDLLLTRN